MQKTPENALPSQEKLLVLTAGAGNILRIAPALTVSRLADKESQKNHPLVGGNSKTFGIVTPLFGEDSYFD